MATNNPQFIILHHSAVSREQNSEQFDAINNYHRSKGWDQIGYHYLIEHDGTVKEGRSENEEGAHCYQESMNRKSIGICFSGNFDIEEPTVAQLASGASLVCKLMEKYGIAADKVVGHRVFANYKSCPGLNFPDVMIYELTQEEMSDQERKILLAAAAALSAAWESLPEEERNMAADLAKRMREMAN